MKVKPLCFSRRGGGKTGCGTGRCGVFYCVNMLFFNVFVF